MRNDTELTPLRSLVPDQRPKVLLVGNGINLSFPSGIDSCKDIIKTELAYSGSPLSYEQIKDMPGPDADRCGDRISCQRADERTGWKTGKN